MGSLNPASVLSGLNSVTSVAKAVSGITSGISTITEVVSEDQRRKELVASQELALKQLEQQQKLEEAQLASNVALQKSEIAAAAAASERERKAALKRAVAKQNAAYGASGTGSSGGSAQAVLLGMFEESEDERTEREQLDALKNAALDQSAGNTKSLNILQRAQLMQQQQLARASY